MGRPNKHTETKKAAVSQGPKGENDSQPMAETKTLYPSAELIQSICYEEYQRALDNYNRIYDKVNIALVFVGVVLIAFISTIDYKIISQLCQANFWGIFYSFCSLVSAFCILWAGIKLLVLLKSKKVYSFDCTAMRKNELYRFTKESTSVWLIDKYTKAIMSINDTKGEKQRRFDQSIGLIIIALICYVGATAIGKGMGL